MAVGVVFIGTRVFGRHLADAWVAARPKLGEQVSGIVTGANVARLRMSYHEAVKILDVKQPIAPEALEERFRRVFEANEPSRGGSFYLQSKAFRARERILEELNAEQPPN